jgi:hypothetical protein
MGRRQGNARSSATNDCRSCVAGRGLAVSRSGDNRDGRAIYAWNDFPTYTNARAASSTGGPLWRAGNRGVTASSNCWPARCTFDLGGPSLSAAAATVAWRRLAGIRAASVVTVVFRVIERCGNQSRPRLSKPSKSYGDQMSLCPNVECEVAIRPRSLLY